MAHTSHRKSVTGPDQAIKTVVNMEDLSAYPRPFALPAKFFNGNRDVTNGARLPLEAKKSFDEKGYYVAPEPVMKSIPEELAVEAFQALSPFYPRRTLLLDFDEKYSNYIVGAWRCLYGVHDQIWNKHLSIPASQLLGGAPIRLSHDLITSKQFMQFMPIHQLYHYWRWMNDPQNGIVVLVPLRNCPVDEDPLMVFPGSHKLGLLESHSQRVVPQPVTYQTSGPVSTLGPFVGSAKDPLYPVPDPSAVVDQSLTPTQRLRALGFTEPMVRSIPVEKHAELKPVRLPLQRGRAVFMHPLLAWGSLHNKTLERRTMLMYHFMKDGSTFNANHAPLDEEGRMANYPLLRHGDKLEGRTFPKAFVPPPSFFNFIRKAQIAQKSEAASVNQDEATAPATQDLAATPKQS